MKKLLRNATAAALTLPAALVHAHEAGSAHSHSGEALFLGFIFLTVCGGMCMLRTLR